MLYNKEAHFQLSVSPYNLANRIGGSCSFASATLIVDRHSSLENKHTYKNNDIILCYPRFFCFGCSSAFRNKSRRRSPDLSSVLFATVAFVLSLGNYRENVLKDVCKIHDGSWNVTMLLRWLYVVWEGVRIRVSACLNVHLMQLWSTYIYL